MVFKAKFTHIDSIQGSSSGPLLQEVGIDQSKVWDCTKRSEGKEKGLFLDGN
jgi:hypothetical protein